MVTMGFLLGSLLGDIEPRAEMISRTRPDLFDLFNLPATFLAPVHHCSKAERIHVAAAIHTPAIPTLTQVTRLQDPLRAQIGMPVESILHCLFSNNVPARGQ